MPLTEGSFPYPFIRANCPATLSMKAIQKGLRRLAKVTKGRTLGDDLQDVDEGLPGGERGEVFRLNDAIVVEDVAVEEQDIAPTIHGLSCRQVPRLLPKVPIQEEGVGVEHRKGAVHTPRPGDQSRAVQSHQTTQRPQGRPKSPQRGRRRSWPRCPPPGSTAA